MATLHVVLSRVSSRAATGATVMVPESVERGAATLTPGASSALSGLTAADEDVWTVTSTGGAAWLKFGPGTPVAVSGAGWLILDGETRDFAASAASEKLAYKTAT